MPRTNTKEYPGCPPIRALTFDVLGLVKVIESRKEKGIPKVVERWGEPDASKSVVSVSIDDCELNPIVAVARKSDLIDLINPLNGEVCFGFFNHGDDGSHTGSDYITGLHVFGKQRLNASYRSCMLLTCTINGKVNVRSIDISGSDEKSKKIWNVCASGNILCSKVDGSEKYALFGGKNVEVNVWDLDQCTKIWTAKSPPLNSLGIFTPAWVTCATFLTKNDHRKFASGINNHQLRIYDISAQRRPVMSLDFRESPIKAVTEDLDGHTIYVGNGCGDLASVDVRTGKLIGCFKGKCSGSIRSIVRHPQLPVMASCGLDAYLRFWDVKTRELLYAVFLKQHLTKVVFDSHFSAEEVGGSLPDPPPQTEEEDIVRKEEFKKRSERKDQTTKGRMSKKIRRHRIHNNDDYDDQ